MIMNNNFIWEHKTTKEYIICCKQLKSYYQYKFTPPVDIMNAYRKALFHYRIFLDKQGFKIPDQKIKYNSKDTRTWKYILVLQGKITKEIINPKYPKLI